jgi:hypothetical protein
MSLIKAYYISRVSSDIGYTYDGIDFVSLPTIPPELGGKTGCVGIDPNNGNKVIFASGDSGFTYIVTSDDHGNTTSVPGGDWTTFDIVCDGGVGSRIIVLDSLTSYIYGTAGIYKSIDGGLTYDIVNNALASLVLFSINFVKMHMSDEFNGILGLSNVSSSTAVKLFRTSDGCVTWTPIIGFDSLNSSDQICGVHMSSDGNIMVVVGKSNIYRSTDAGANWTIAASFSTINNSLYGAALDAVNENVMYALGGNNTVYKSVDAGATWTSQSSDSTVPNSHLFSFYSETEGYTSRTIAGQNVILRTLDSGVTWTQVDTATSTPVDLQSVSYNCGECPEDYTKIGTDECDNTSLGPLLCPTGFLYDAQTGTCIGAGDCPPSEIVFVLDIGASVTPSEQQKMQDFLYGVVDSANITAGLSAGTIKLGFCVFAGSAPTGTGLYRLSLTNNIVAINNWINTFATLTVAGGTNTASGLQAGVTDILFASGNNPAATKKIILVTDGTPESVRNPNTVSNTADTYTITNNEGLSFSYTITNDTTEPCGRGFGAGDITDCTRCEIWEKTLQAGDFIKNQLNVHITVAILAETLATDLNNILAPAQNPSGAPSIESYQAYRALITGRIDRQTHIFPPSQDPSSPYFVPTGYGPPNPIAGGHLGLTGFTDQTTGITFGRLTWGSLVSTNNIEYYSSTATNWPALPAIYDSIAIVVDNPSNVFNPYYAYDCDPSAFAPLCSLKTDGSNDVYVSDFDNAASTLAPEIAEGICSAIIPVSCPEGCDLVQEGNNARCQCQKKLYIVPCTYNVYDCTDLITPVYCTQDDLADYIGSDIIVKITVDGSEAQGCYQIGISNVDYCEPLDYSVITVIESYTSCAECQPNFVRLTSCNNEEIYLQVASDYLSNNIGKAVELLEYPGLCWRVDFEPTFPTVTATVNIKEIYDDCDCCKQYSCKS